MRIFTRNFYFLFIKAKIIDKSIVRHAIGKTYKIIIPVSGETKKAYDEKKTRAATAIVLIIEMTKKVAALPVRVGRTAVRLWILPIINMTIAKPIAGTHAAIRSSPPLPRRISARGNSMPDNATT